MEFEIGDWVRYVPGFRGYYAATVVELNGTRYVVEFELGCQLNVREGELERQ